MYYVYILKCSDHSFYTGITNDLNRRLKQHNKGLASKYTRVRRPVEYVYQKEVSDKGEALREEWRIKRLTRSQKEKLIFAQQKKEK